MKPEVARGQALVLSDYVGSYWFCGGRPASVPGSISGAVGVLCCATLRSRCGVVLSSCSRAKGSLSALVLERLTHMRVWFLLDSEGASVGPFFDEHNRSRSRRRRGGVQKKVSGGDSLDSPPCHEGENKLFLVISHARRPTIVNKDWSSQNKRFF